MTAGSRSRGSVAKGWIFCIPFWYFLNPVPNKNATPQKKQRTRNWLVVEPTHLKNMSQNGNLPQIGVKIKNVWNHHLGKQSKTAPNFLYQKSLNDPFLFIYKINIRDIAHGVNKIHHDKHTSTWQFWWLVTFWNTKKKRERFQRLYNRDLQRWFKLGRCWFFEWVYGGIH